MTQEEIKIITAAKSEMVRTYKVVTLVTPVGKFNSPIDKFFRAIENTEYVRFITIKENTKVGSYDAVIPISSIVYIKFWK